MRRQSFLGVNVNRSLYCGSDMFFLKLFLYKISVDFFQSTYTLVSGHQISWVSD